MNTTKPGFFTRANIKLPARGTVVVLELANEADALEVGRRLAEQTGRTVTVRDDNGVPLETFKGSGRH